MTIDQESLKAHDYNKKMRALARKGAALKKKSRELNAKLADTIKKCDQLLHPEKKLS
jgi:hypothetical protein